MTNKEIYKCYICDCEIEKEMMVTANDQIVLGVYAIVVRNMQLAICSVCFAQWNKILELLVSRFKEQKHIDEEICKKILEYKDE